MKLKIQKTQVVQPIEEEKLIQPDTRSVTNKLDDLLRYFEIAKSSKKFKERDLPLNFRKGKQLLKKNKVMAIVLRTNGNIETKKCPIVNGLLHLDGKYHNGAAYFLWWWRSKIPTYIIPEWDINPIGRKGLHDEAVEAKRTIHPQVVTIRALKQEMAGMKMAMGGKAWIWIIIGAMALLYFIFGGGVGG